MVELRIESIASTLRAFCVGDGDQSPVAGTWLIAYKNGHLVDVLKIIQTIRLGDVFRSTQEVKHGVCNLAKSSFLSEVILNNSP